MQFNSDSDNQDLISLTRDLTNTDSAGYPLQAITRAMNMRFREIWSTIFDAYGGWTFDDSNQTNLPEATTALVSGTGTYAIPTGASYVKGVEIKNTGGVWFQLYPITLEQIKEETAEGYYFSVQAQPLYYRIIGTTIKLYPPPNFSQADSLKVFYTRDISQFASTDTTKVPGIESQFHELLAYGAALSFAERKTSDNTQSLFGEWQSGLKRMRDFYSRRFNEMFPARITVRDAVREYM